MIVLVYIECPIDLYMYIRYYTIIPDISPSQAIAIALGLIWTILSLCL